MIFHSIRAAAYQFVNKNERGKQCRSFAYLNDVECTMAKKIQFFVILYLVHIPFITAI